MLRDYRDFLESELKLLGNSSHHAYAFGQANMAKRALDALDRELHANIYVALDNVEARKILTAIELSIQRSTAPAPELEMLRDALTAAIKELGPPPGTEPESAGDVG